VHLKVLVEQIFNTGLWYLSMVLLVYTCVYTHREKQTSYLKLTYSRIPPPVRSRTPWAGLSCVHWCPCDRSGRFGWPLGPKWRTATYKSGPWEVDKHSCIRARCPSVKGRPEFPPTIPRSSIPSCFKYIQSVGNAFYNTVNW